MQTMVQQRFVTDTRGRKTAVIISLRKYEQLLEDLHDLAVAAERRNERTISLADMKKRLASHG